MEISDNVLDRLAKLIELQSRPGTVAEAEAAAGRIQALLTKHQLTMLDAERLLADKPGAAEFVTESFTLERYTDWRDILLNGIAKQNFCRSIRLYEKTRAHATNRHGKRLGHSYKLIGRVENIAAVLRLFEYLDATIDALGKKYAEALSARYGPEFRAIGLRYNPKGAGNEFRGGAVIGVVSKMYAARETAVADAGSSALVVVEEEKLDAAVDAAIGPIQSGKMLEYHGGEHFRAGVVAGYGINTDPQLAQTGTSGTLRAGTER